MSGVKELLRQETMPHMLCPGCGHGIVMGALLRVLSKRFENLDNVVLVAGIGCSSRIVSYIDGCTVHTTHGRALTFATGIKLARPELTVIVVTGDGDGLSIGGNHLLHAARRNVGLTCILFNNETYGMTGGQLAPTTVLNAYSSTSPYGNTEPAFDAANLAIAAGASFVARGQAFRTDVLEDLIDQALDNDGFSFLDVMTDCTEYFVRKNSLGTGSDMLFSQGSVDAEIQSDLAASPTIRPADGWPVRDILPNGVLHKAPRPSLSARLAPPGNQATR